MSGYPGRRGGPANVSQLLQDLNRIPDPVPQRDDNPPNLEDELAMFTNTQFTDWDLEMAHPTVNPPSTSIESETTSLTTSPSDRLPGEQALGDLNFDFHMGGDFNGFDFQQYPTPNVNSFSDNLGTLPPIHPSPTYSAGSQQSPYASSMQSAGDKRPSDAGFVSQRRQLSLEDQQRIGAEEDKRRRNTAASARFRVKKKAREQALEKREKELSDKVGALESRVQSLETENKWLRELVMEKNGGSESIVSMLDKQKSAEAKEKLAKAESSST
ncbi:hypothetical protein GGR57DRAFT_463858 [Xylariaceae sp. FL1272]|nr:hypothetical protein GGR57DRAFT_463858 [Xylariaceae sp. FL1272]